MSTRSSVDESFGIGIVRMRCGRGGNDVAENVVKMGGKFVAAWVDVYGWGECLYEDGFLYAPFYPIVVRCEDGDIVFAEVVVVVSGVLQHG